MLSWATFLLKKYWAQISTSLWGVLPLSLQVLREWLEVMVHQTKSLMMNSDRNHHSALHNHNQLQLRQQLEALDRAVCELQVTSQIFILQVWNSRQAKSAACNLIPMRCVTVYQTFSSLVLKTFSSDCKRVSGEIFEQTMPSAVHWRLSHRTGTEIWLTCHKT